MQGEQKKYDLICFEIQRKERVLRQLANQASDLEKKLEDTEEIVQPPRWKVWINFVGEKKKRKDWRIESMGRKNWNWRA